MDGGAAELVSPLFPMQSRFSYGLEAEMSCQQLDGHSAWIELQLLNAAEQVIQVLRSDTLQGTLDWQKLATPLASVPSEQLKWGRIHVKVEPHSSTVLAGVARFDSIAVYRMPRLSLGTTLAYNIARPAEEFAIDCVAMGIRESDTGVRFELSDHEGNVLQQETRQLTISASQESSQQPPTAPDRNEVAEKRAKTPYYVALRSGHRAIDGHTQWPLKLEQPGLYRVKVNLGVGGQHSQFREILIGVMPEKAHAAAGPFGWSLPAFDQNLSVDEVPELVRRFGAGWVKLPVWFDSEGIATADRLVALIERLQSLGTQVVGKLDLPPQSLRETFGDGHEHLYAVNIFREPKDWEPALEPVLTRIGMKLPWFQIGADSDNSFVGKQDLEQTIASLRSRMQTYSQELKLALTWTWLDPVPTPHVMAWNAVHFNNSPQLTADELAAYASNYSSEASLWISMDPLPARNYSLIDRVRDLTQRMIAVKRAPVAAAFVDNPFRPELGLFSETKSIGEMLIPWHTLVTEIGPRNYMGSITLPGDSINHVLEHDGQTVMLLWNDMPTVEQIYLGESLQLTDIWGKELPVTTVLSQRGAPEQQFSVGPWPVLLHGIDRNIIRFHQQFQLQIDNLESGLTVVQSLPVTITNTLPQSSSGKVMVVSPTLLSGERSESPLQLSNALQQTKALPVYIRNDASAGKHRLRFDFDLVSNKAYQFSIYRSITLGRGDIELVWDATRTVDDALELRVEILNNTEQSASFDCKLFPIGRPYQRFRLEESKPGASVQELRLKLNQVEVGSEAWLRCEQIGTGRVLNFRLQL